MTEPAPTLLAVSHGTSDAGGARAIADLVAAVAARLPDVEVREAFVDVQQPEAGAALAGIEGPVVVVPLLLSTGFHVKHDLGGAVRDRRDAVLADPLGPDPRLAEVLADRLREADLTSSRGSDDPVILVAAGSRDDESEQSCAEVSRALAERIGRPVTTAYLAARTPTLAEAVAQHPDAPVATYLLAHGYFNDVTVREVATHGRGARSTEPLLVGGHPPAPLVELVIARYREAVDRG